MKNEPFSKECVICNSEFLAGSQKQIYCSYGCYAVAANTRSKEYYKKLKVLKQPIPKICAVCHNHFETTRQRMIYCSHDCYRDASLEKNRAYSQALRDRYKELHPIVKERECSLCFNKFEVKSNNRKYCDECALLARKMLRGQGPIYMPGNFKNLTPGEPLLPLKPSTAICFVCGGPAADALTPCDGCNK
jgi:hypothetical protein